jgi:hypothetical protein
MRLAGEKAKETLVSMADGPHYACVRLDGSVFLVASLHDCAMPGDQAALTLPPTGSPAYFCALKQDNLLTYVISPLRCLPMAALAVVVPAARRDLGQLDRRIGPAGPGRGRHLASAVLPDDVRAPRVRRRRHRCQRGRELPAGRQQRQRDSHRQRAGRKRVHRRLILLAARSGRAPCSPPGRARRCPTPATDGQGRGGRRPRLRATGTPGPGPGR